MAAITVIRNSVGALNAYIGNEWADSFGSDDAAAIDWLDARLSSAQRRLSTKSIYTMKDIESRRAEIAALDARYAH